MPKTKLTKEEYNSLKQKWIKDTVYCMDREQVEHFATLYFQEDFKDQEQEDVFETMQSVDDEVFSTLAEKFNLEVE